MQFPKAAFRAGVIVLVPFDDDSRGPDRAFTRHHLRGAAMCRVMVWFLNIFLMFHDLQGNLDRLSLFRAPVGPCRFPFSFLFPGSRQSGVR